MSPAFRRTSLPPRVSSRVLALLAASACGVDDRQPEVGEEFTRHLSYGVEATPQVSPLPSGVGTGPQVVALPQHSTPLEVRPGDDVTFAVGWQGGDIASVNMSFTINQYFSIPVPLAAGSTEGVAEIPASVGAGVCDALDDICHQIECLEQVVSVDGAVSIAHTLQLVLDCGGAGCAATGSGTSQPGDPCDATMECIPGSVCFNKFCVGAGTLRVSLAFSVDSDFDLHVMTPSGEEIYFVNQSADGGTLDVDQCISACGEEPHAENVVFDDTVLPGTYEVWVVNFDGRAAGDFSIEIAGDAAASFSGTLPATSGVASEHFTFTL